MDAAAASGVVPGDDPVDDTGTDADSRPDAHLDSEPSDRVAATRAAAVSAAVLAAATIAVGLINIGRGFNYDEAITYGTFINGGSVRRALTTQVVFNNHPMFSVTQAIAWRVGFVGETAQRLGPVLCGAVTVGAITWATARRVGVVGGVVAGAVLLLNPVFLTEFRNLRGYSLATMCVVLAALAALRSWDDRRVRWLIAQAVPMVVAVTTHAYSAVPILLIAVATLAVGRLRPAHLTTWVSAAAVAFVIQLPLLDDAIDQSRARGSVFNAAFPRLAARLLLGQVLVAVAITAVLLAIGLWTVARRSNRHLVTVGACVATVVAVVLLLWLVVQPRDLYARFFIGLVPFMAALVGVGVSKLPRSAGIAAAVVVVAALASEAREAVRAESGIRAAGEIVDTAQRRGLAVCGNQAEPLRVYAAPIPLIDGIDDFGDCQVYVSVLRLSPSAHDAAAQRFEGRRRLPGGILIWGDEVVLRDIVDAP